VVLLSESLGTTILVAAYSVNLQGDSFYFALPAIYFVLLMLLLPLSGAQMNPALTTAVLISNRDPKSWKYALMTISS